MLSPDDNTGMRSLLAGLKHAALNTLLVLLSSILIHSTAVAGGAREFTNLQFLPEDTSTAQMLGIMKRMTAALGAECRSCHRTDIRDFASDDIAAKSRAREMMGMMAEMNRQLSANKGDSAQKVSCFSCHQGQLRPVSSTHPGI